MATGRGDWLFFMTKKWADYYGITGYTMIEIMRSLEIGEQIRKNVDTFLREGVRVFVL